MSAGRLSPEEGQGVAELLRTYVALADTVDLAKRLEALETAAAERDAEMETRRAMATAANPIAGSNRGGR